MKDQIITYLIKFSCIMLALYVFNAIYPGVMNKELKDLTGSLKLMHVVVILVCSLR